MKRRMRIWNVLLALAVIFGLAATTNPPTVVQAVSENVVISQVYGGGGNTGATYKNDFIELYNRGTAAVDLTGWSVQYYSSGGTATWSGKTDLTGTIQPGKYYLVQEAAGTGGTTNLPTPDASGSIAMSGTAGKVALVNSTTALSGACPTTGVVDLVGFGSANCSETSPTPALSNTTAALRNNDGATDTDNNLADFTVGAPNPRNSSFAPPADVAPAVESVTPANNANNVAADTNITVTFTEPVDVSGAWFTLSCDVSGAHTAVVSGGSTSYTLDPDTDFGVNDTCTLTIVAAQVSDQDAIDPPDTLGANYTSSFFTGNVCALPFTPAYSIQGSGATAAITGTVTTQGVVVGDYEGASPTLRGFYLQDATGDANPATSDGIFVYNASNDNVALGDVVRVTGSAGENQGQTQVSATDIQACGTGTVTPVDVALPFTSATEPEQYEGMLVRFPQTLYVTEMFQLGRFGQVTLSSGGRLAQPTNVVAPGTEALALQAANNLNRIILDDALNNQNPDPIVFSRSGEPLSASNTLRGGDTATGIVGVMTYTWAGNSASGNAYRVRPIGALNGFVDFEPTNPRPATTAPEASGRLRVAGMNVLNFFNTFTNCTMGVGDTTPSTSDCRGANNQTEFDRQWPKTVAQIIGTGADVIGLTEVENDGYGPDSAIAFLVSKLNEATAPGTYAFVNVDTLTGQTDAMGTDAIKNAFIYKTTSVSLTGTTAVLNSSAFVNGGDSSPRNRPALAQAFEENATGAKFVAVINHLKSKGSACDTADAGDGQGNCNEVRETAATLEAEWLASDPTETGDTDALILGDMNSYAMEDPITALKTAGYTDLIKQFEGADAYSYVFDGQWGYLDHALGNASMAAQVVDVTTWHINSDEPSVLDYNTDFKSTGQIESLYAPDVYRTADHDPVLVDINLVAPAVAAPIENQKAVATMAFSFQVPATTFTPAAEGDTFTYTATLEDGSALPAWLSFDAATLTFTGTPPAEAEGTTLSIKVTATDNNGLKVSDTFDLSIWYAVRLPLVFKQPLP